MSLLSTVKAYLSLTLVAFHHVLALEWIPAHVAVTCRLGAPAQIWIKIYHGIALEAFILIEQALTDTVQDIIFTEFLRATSVHTANIDNLSFVNRCLEVVFMAKFAEFVLTLQAIKLGLLRLFIA